jgi:Copper amine oxidase, enzyme domain
MRNLVYVGGKSGHLRRDRALCVFEHDTAKPLTRHTGDNLNEMGATKGFVLVVRSIATVGKYVVLPHLSLLQLSSLDSTSRLCLRPRARVRPSSSSLILFNFDGGYVQNC